MPDAVDNHRLIENLPEKCKEAEFNEVEVDGIPTISMKIPSSEMAPGLE